MSDPRHRASTPFTGIVLSCIALILPLLTACARTAQAGDRQTLADWQSANRDELKPCFDAVARNLGIVDAAFLSFTLEFRRVPESGQELLETGHLPVLPPNPYTGEAIRLVDVASISDGIREKLIAAGDIWFAPDPEEGMIQLAGLFLDPNQPSTTKWMQRDMIQYFDPAVHQVLYGDAPAAGDRQVRINMEHFLTAIEGYEIRFGMVPPTYEALRGGDMLVEFPNPFTPDRLSQSSRQYTAGDFYYESLSDDEFILIGWGATGATWFASPSYAQWGIRMQPADADGWELVTMDPDGIEAIRLAGLEQFSLPTDFLINREVAVEFVGWQIEQANIAAWKAAHPECPDCGSTYVFWAKRDDGTVVCIDERDGQLLDDCCCQDLPKIVLQ